MFNKVIVVGHLTKDIEMRFLNTGSALATSSIATNRKYKKQDGSMGEDICYIDFKMFGRLAETANKFLKKGSKVLLEGRLVFETWSDSTGANRSKHSIMVDNLEFLDAKRDATNRDSEQNDDTYNDGYTNKTRVQSESNPINLDDDMPF